LATVLIPGGRSFLLYFSDEEPGRNVRAVVLAETDQGRDILGVVRLRKIGYKL